MTWLASIPIIGDLFKNTTDIIKEVVLDKDAQNKILENLVSLKEQIAKEIYLKELETKTVPWVDGLHKMSRIILSFSCISATVLLMVLGHEITPTVAIILGGPTAAYTIIKGKG